MGRMTAPGKGSRALTNLRPKDGILWNSLMLGKSPGGLAGPPVRAKGAGGAVAARAMQPTHLTHPHDRDIIGPSQPRSLPMDVSLSPELEQFIQAEVGNGHYRSPDDVIRAALVRFRQDPTPRQPELPDTLEELEQRLLERIQRLDRGEWIDGAESLRQMREWMKEATAARG